MSGITTAMREVAREALLEPGETITKLDLRGWIVLGNLISAGDEAIIDWPDNHIPQLFDRPIRVTITGVTSNNLLRLNIQTAGAKDDRGVEWKTGDKLGCFSVMRYVWKIEKV